MITIWKPNAHAIAGTGKSSLVNALCIGLGGKPNVSSPLNCCSCLQHQRRQFVWRLTSFLWILQLLGRADHVQDFVRKGTSEGYTEIHLSSGQPRPVIIKRCLSSTSNSTEWYLNGAQPPAIGASVA